jgi:hypothetical protein
MQKAVCNQEQGFTACGVDQLLVVCSFDQASQSGCLHDSGPCHHGLSRDGYVGECQGRSQYAIHLPTEAETRPTKKHQQARSALSLAVAALCEMTYQRNDETRAREEIFLKALAEIRMVAGDIRLTSMRVTCAWCNKGMGHKEGNGSTGETSTICPECLAKQMSGNVPPEVRRIAAAVGEALNPEDRSELEAFRRQIYEGLKRPETRETAKVAALTVPSGGDN